MVEADSDCESACEQLGGPLLPRGKSSEAQSPGTFDGFFAIVISVIIIRLHMIIKNWIGPHLA